MAHVTSHNDAIMKPSVDCERVVLGTATGRFVKLTVRETTVNSAIRKLEEFDVSEI